MTGVLAGIRVLDFGRYIAGPYCAALLAEHGAEVIRIEKREGSEDRFQAPVTPTGDGALFMQMNRNKRGMTLDPMRPEGREVVARLVKTADVVVANLPPQTLSAMGLDYASLTAIKPDVILTTVSAFGRGGPYSDRVGFDGVGQVMSGAVYMTGEGQVVEGALLATAVTLGNALLIEQAVKKPDRVPTGNRGQTAAPVDIFKTRDGFILVQVIGEPLFRRWAKLMDEDHWLEDARFKDDISRGDNGAVVSERMARWCADYTTAEALEILGKAKIPAGPVLKPQQTLDDPHIQAMGFFQATDFPGMARPAPIAKAPVWLSQTPGAIRHRAPVLGEHTEEILTELGYDRGAIRTLREKGVV